MKNKNILDESNFNSPFRGLGGSLAANSLYISITKAMLTSEGKTNLEIDTVISNNELLCLFGHSGAGKTTLLRILAGLTKPDKGRIVFNDTVWFESEKKINLPPQERNVGYMFQDYALFPNMTVEKNISFGQKEKNKEEVDKLIELFDLQILKNQHPAKLSGGQKQRVALARALAAKPNMLLLDEPLSALDFEMRLALQHEIRKAHELLNTVTVMVSHDLQEVFHLASSVIMLKNGTVIKEGKPADVFSPESLECKLKMEYYATIFHFQ
jgi:molybdate transport system ATP-binding protein